MNAYELADELDSISVNNFESLDHHHYTREASTMLRQQAKRIEELEKDFKKLFWMLDEKNKQLHKELSDEEISEIAYEHNLLDDYPHGFARAIIKASRGEE